MNLNGPGGRAPRLGGRPLIVVRAPPFSPAVAGLFESHAGRQRWILKSPACRGELVATRRVWRIPRVSELPSRARCPIAVTRAHCRCVRRPRRSGISGGARAFQAEELLSAETPLGGTGSASSGLPWLQRDQSGAVVAGRDTRARASCRSCSGSTGADQLGPARRAVDAYSAAARPRAGRRRRRSPPSRKPRRTHRSFAIVISTGRAVSAAAAKKTCCATDFTS